MVLAFFILLVMVIAAAWDVRRRAIPNWLTASGLVVALACAPWGPLGGDGYVRPYLAAFAGAGVGLGALFILYMLGLGAGDVKFGTFIGASLGWTGIAISMAGGLATAGLVTMAVGGRKRSLPVGAFMAAFGLVTLWLRRGL